MTVFHLSRFVAALLFVAMAVPSLAHADYYNNSMSTTPAAPAAHYPMQHYDEPQMAEPADVTPAGYNAPHQYAPSKHAMPSTHQGYEMSPYAATPATPTYAPAATAGPDDFTNGERYGHKVDRAAEAYKAAHPDAMHNGSSMNHAPMGVPEGARFKNAAPQRELKLVNGTTTTETPVKSHKRHTSLFSTEKTARPFEASWNSTYLH